MCLIIHSDVKPVVLEEDTIVYKHCYLEDKDNEIRSSIQFFKYELGKLYETELGVYDPKSHNFARCIFSRHLKTADGRTIGEVFPHLWEYPYDFKSVVHGFHSFVDLKTAEYHLTGGYIAKCVIPKGSTVYYDLFGLCASNKIIIERIL